MAIPNGLKTTLITLTWFPVLYSFTNHVYQPYQISGSSMTPTFNPGTSTTSKDIVLVQKYNLKSANSLHRGDIVMFRSPSNPEKILTKRIIATQGEVVRTKSPPYPKQQVTVPRNHVWVEGDNSFHSIDSNNFGPVSQGLVVGKVVFVIWPLSRFGYDGSSSSTNTSSGGLGSTNSVVNNEMNDATSIQVKRIDEF
ncbi:peptidase S24/S26A/S26B/S26C [Scheffersomyces amazonensis]|uniref:peptidase S24/S26A/S26B/S26C n=1 Tax=Scheffersomyces amazonensis TaxID=1078765 RepID=UPI00315D37E4